LHTAHLPREHIEQHAEIDGLSHAAGADGGHHARPYLLRIGLVGKRHGRLTAVAHFRVVGVPFATDVAGDLGGEFG
jgi:hypothetical protein